MGQQFLDFEGTKIIANKIKETDNKIETLKTSQNLEYEGETITCENTLVSRTFDIVVSGKTYQNLLGRVTFGQTTTDEDNDYIFTGVADGYSTFYIYPSLNLQSNKKYTIILNAKNLTLTNNSVFTLDYFNDSTLLYGNEIRTTGVHKFVVQITSDITSMRLQIENGENCNLTFSKDIIILEGDWTDKEVPESITGIESAGEKENKISILSKNNKSTDYINYKQDKKEILLPIVGGLKSLPNGVCDTIEQRNDGVYLVQRVNKIVLDGSENWELIKGKDSVETLYFQILFKGKNVYIICDKIKVQNANYLWNNDVEGLAPNGKGNFHFRINKSRLSTQNTDGLKAWLQANPVTIYYILDTPVETKLDINNLNLEVYKDLTYVTTDNAIQPVLNLKIPSNIGGMIQANTENINKLYKLIDEVIIPQLVANSADIEILKLQ